MLLFPTLLFQVTGDDDDKGTAMEHATSIATPCVPAERSDEPEYG